jgi:sec-independent protein translocase protein TatA
MLNIGPQELLIILVIALIVVGPTRLPELGRSIGKGIREIRKAQDEVKRTIQVSMTDAPASSGVKRAPSSPTAGDATPAAVSPDPTPSAIERPAASEVSEISRTLGQGLAELRRARDEVQRSFRVDLGAGTAKPAATTREPAASSPATPESLSEPPQTDETPAG